MAHRGDNTQEIQQTGRRDGAHTVELDARPLAKGVWREDGIGGPLLAEGAHSPAKEAILQQGGMNDDGVRIEREDVCVKGRDPLVRECHRTLPGARRPCRCCAFR
jgi:hypothetical protein